MTRIWQKHLSIRCRPSQTNITACYAWWRHQTETFSALLALCEGNPPVNGGFPHKGQWRRALMFSLSCAPINGWGNNRDAGDLRRHCAHYGVTVMEMRNLGSIYVHLQLYANVSRLRLSVRMFKWKYWGIKITERVGYTISYNAKIASHQLSRNIQKTLQIANLYDILLCVKNWSMNYSSAVIKHWYLVK